MITEERVLILLARANPEPDESFDLDSDAAAYLDTIQRGSSTMTQLETGPNKRDTSSRNRLMAVAAAVVAVLGLGVIILTATDDQAPLAAPSTPEGVALAFLEARETHDAAAALALVDDEAVVRVGPADSKETLAFEIAFAEATGLVAKPEGCRPVDMQLFCTAEVTTAITRARGLDADTFRYAFVVSDDRITNVNLFDIGNYSAENWEPFQAWISRNHVSDLEIMYESSSAIAVSDESLALWETRTAEYVEELTNGLEG